LTRFIVRIFAIAFVFCGSFLLAAGDAPAGKVVYDAKCKSCHGENGEGNGKIAAMLKVDIPKLGSSEVQSAPDDTIRKRIVEGAGKMKAVKGLTDKDIQNLIAHLRTLKQ